MSPHAHLNFCFIFISEGKLNLVLPVRVIVHGGMDSHEPSQGNSESHSHTSRRPLSPSEPSLSDALSLDLRHNCWPDALVHFAVSVDILTL